METIREAWFVLLVSSAVCLLIAFGAYVSLVRYLHEQLVHALGKQMTVESSTALRSQLPEWARKRVVIMAIAAALAGVTLGVLLTVAVASFL